MSFVFRSNSLLSSIAAIDFSQNLNLEVRIKSGDLPSFDRFYSINEFSKIYLNKLGIWENLETSKNAVISKCCHSARSRKTESQNPSAEDSWIFKVENPLLKNQSRGRIQTEVS